MDLQCPIPSLFEYQPGVVHRLHQLLPGRLRHLHHDTEPADTVIKPTHYVDTATLAAFDNANKKVKPRVKAMRLMLLRQSYSGYNVTDDKGTLLKQLVLDKRFDSLAYMNDDGAGAFNKMSIMLWTHGLLNQFYCSEIHHAYALEYNRLAPRPSIPSPHAYQPGAIRRLHRILPSRLRYQDYIPQDDGTSVFGLLTKPSNDIGVHMQERTHALSTMARRGTVISVSHPAGPYTRKSGLMRWEQRVVLAKTRYQDARVQYQTDTAGKKDLPVLHHDEGGTTPPEFNTWLKDNIQ